MAKINTDISSLAKRLSDSLGQSLEDAIRYELLREADVIVTKIAKEMAQSLHGSIQTWDDYTEQRLQVKLVIDGVSELVPPK